MGEEEKVLVGGYMLADSFHIWLVEFPSGGERRSLIAAVTHSPPTYIATPTLKILLKAHEYPWIAYILSE